MCQAISLYWTICFVDSYQIATFVLKILCLFGYYLFK